MPFRDFEEKKWLSLSQLIILPVVSKVELVRLHILGISNSVWSPVVNFEMNCLYDVSVLLVELHVKTKKV